MKKKSEALEVTEEVEEEFSLKREIFGWVESILVAIIVVALIITFVGRMMTVDGTSMLPTLLNGERIITTPLYTELEHNDIVVIRRKGDKPLVKRVIALAGETVDINYETHTVTINGEEVDQPFINGEMMIPTYRTIRFPAVVPEGHVFVMGDNRNHSLDSRSEEVGMIDERNVFGKAICRVWPLDKIGSIDTEDYTY